MTLLLLLHCSSAAPPLLLPPPPQLLSHLPSVSPQLRRPPSRRPAASNNPERIRAVSAANAAAMGVQKKVLKQGNGVDLPKKHDEVSMEYTGTPPHVLAALAHPLQDGSTTRARWTTRAPSKHLALPAAPANAPGSTRRWTAATSSPRLASAVLF